MINPLVLVTIIEDINKVLPVVQGAIVDVNAAIAARKDPTVEAAALVKIFGDLQSLFAALAPILPAVAQQAAPVAPAPVVAPTIG